MGRFVNFLVMKMLLFEDDVCSCEIVAKMMPMYYKRLLDGLI